MGLELSTQIDGDKTAGDDSTRESIIDSLVSERTAELAELEDDELMKEIREAWVQLKASLPKIECRVENGSFTVTSKVEIDNVNGNTDDDEEEPKRAKQHIETVATASPLQSFFRRIYKQIRTRGNAFQEETRTIMSKVNLRFETGKVSQGSPF